jgi:hypothetical protein
MVKFNDLTNGHNKNFKLLCMIAASAALVISYPILPDEGTPNSLDLSRLVLGCRFREKSATSVGVTSAFWAAASRSILVPRLSRTLPWARSHDACDPADPQRPLTANWMKRKGYCNRTDPLSVFWTDHCWKIPV